MPGNPTSHHGGGGISRREHQHREIETQEGFQKNASIDSIWFSSSHRLLAIQSASK